MAWASRCRIPAFAELAAKVRAHLPSIHATLEHGLSNGLVESTNTKVRLLTRWPSASAPPRRWWRSLCSIGAATARRCRAGPDLEPGDGQPTRSNPDGVRAAPQSTARAFFEGRRRIPQQCLDLAPLPHGHS